MATCKTSNSDKIISDIDNFVIQNYHWYGGPQLSHQIQIAHIKFKSLTSNSNCSHQIQIAHIKLKSLTSNSNCSHQIQIAHIKFKSLTSNSIRVSDWSAAKSMNTILSFALSLYRHFVGSLFAVCVYCLIHRSEISSVQNVLQ